MLVRPNSSHAQPLPLEEKELSELSAQDEGIDAHGWLRCSAIAENRDLRRSERACTFRLNLLRACQLGGSDHCLAFRGQWQFMSGHSLQHGGTEQLCKMFDTLTFHGLVATVLPFSCGWFGVLAGISWWWMVVFDQVDRGGVQDVTRQKQTLNTEMDNRKATNNTIKYVFFYVLQTVVKKQHGWEATCVSE